MRISQNKWDVASEIEKEGTRQFDLEYLNVN